MLEIGCVPAGFEQREMPGKIGAFVSKRVFKAVAHPRLRGEVDDALYAVVAHQRGDGGRIGDVEFVEGEALHPLERRQPRRLQRRVVIIVDDIDTDYPFPAGEQLMRRCMTDEPGRAGDEDGIGPLHAAAHRPTAV